MGRIVVIAGQSNAAGRGSKPLIPGLATFGYDVAFPAVQQMYRVEDAPVGLDAFTWDFDVAPSDLDVIASGNGTFGVELSMGRRLHRAGYRHSIVKMAMGSTSLGVHWKAVGGTYPSTGDKLFTQLVNYCTQAETDLEGEIAEFVWVQGETDAGNATHAAAYAANFAVFASTFRTTFPGVPITLNRLHSGAGGTYNSTVRAQQLVIQQTVPGVRIIHADDLELDGAHYTSPAFITLGERFADAILRRRPRVGVRAGMGAA